MTETEAAAQPVPLETEQPPATVLEEKDSTSTMSKLGIQVDKENKRIIKELNGGAQLSVGLDNSHLQAATSILHGQLPSNQEIEKAVNKWKKIIETNSTQLTDQGKKLVQDINELLDSMTKAFTNKNKNDMLQKFLADANLFGRQIIENSSSRDTQNMENEVLSEQNRKQMLAELTEFYANMQSVALFTLRSREFRELLLDIVTFLQSMVRRLDAEYGDKITDSIRQDLLQNTEERISSVIVADESDAIKVKLEAYEKPQPVAIKNLGGEFLQLEKAKKILIKEEEIAKMEDKLKGILDTMSSNPDYNQMVNKILKLFDKLEQIFKQNQENLGQYEKQQREEYTKIMNSLFQIIGEFTGHEQLKECRAHIYQIYETMSTDIEARNYMSELRQFVVECLQKPNTSSSDESRKQQIKQIVEKGRKAFKSQREKYEKELTSLKVSFKNILDHMKKDEDLKDISNKFKNFFKDFFTDNIGKPDIFITQESAAQMRRLMVSLINEHLDNLPLPMIHLDTNSYSLELSNMVLNASELLPQHFHLESKSLVDMKASTFNNEDMSKFNTEMNLKLDTIRMEVKNINYKFQHKKMRKICDKGVAEIQITGSKGISLNVNWNISLVGSLVQLELGKVDCKIDKLVIKIRQSEHKMLNIILSKMLNNMIKSRIENDITQKIKDVLMSVNFKLNQTAMDKKAQLKDIASQKSQIILQKFNKKMKTLYDQTKGMSLKDLKRKIRNPKSSSSVAQEDVNVENKKETNLPVDNVSGNKNKTLETAAQSDPALIVESTA